MGKKTYEEIPVTTLANGHEVKLPIHRIQGDQPGPTLGLVAAIHGEEPLPIVVLKKLIETLDTSQLKGTLLILPVANPFSYEAQNRFTPLDGLNLNRIFPGAPDGYITERIADAIVTKFVPQLDYLIDFHSGGTFPTVDYVYLSRLKPEMSYAFGSHLLYKEHGYQGVLSAVSEDSNIPTTVVEIGGGSLLDDKYIARGLEGAFNVMKHLEMLPGEPRVPTDQVLVTEMAVIKPLVGGILFPEISLDQLGKIVPGDTILGRIFSPYNLTELAVLKTPFAKNYMILIRGMVSRVNPGDFAFMCANADVTA